MNYNYTALIIEPRKHKALEFVLNNILDCLNSDWKILFFYGNNNEEYSKQIVCKLNNLYSNRIFLVKLEVNNLNQKTYSELLSSKYDIYNYIETEYFLIFQTDFMMFKQNAHLINSYLDKDYDYIGSPWVICNYQPTKERNFIGNGGFSLRKKSKMLEIIKNNKWNENYEWHEDLFFTKKYDNIEVKKPSYENAKIFCVDEVFSLITISCHRPWCHSHYGELIKIYPECEVLRSLQFEE